MEIQIRDYQVSDEPQLEQIVLATFPHDETMRDHAYFGETSSGPKYAKTVIALISDQLVGFASFYQNRLHYHPHDFRVNVLVLPDFQGQGVGQRLHRALSSDLPVQAARLRTVTPYPSEAESFLRAFDYRPLLQSFSPELDVQAVKVNNYSSILSALKASGYHFVTLSEFGSRVEAELLNLCLEAYADTHVHSPPTLSEDWESIFLGKGCIDEAFFLALKGTRLIGFSSLRWGDSKDEMESMWDGVSRSERALAYPLRLALKLRELEYARANQVNSLVWEVDSIDLVGMQLMEALPFVVPSAHQIWVSHLSLNT